MRFLASESAKTRDTRGCMRQTVNRKELEVRIWGKIYSDCAEERESLRRRSAVPLDEYVRIFRAKFVGVPRKHSVSLRNNQTLQNDNFFMFLSCPSTTIANSPRQSYLECFQKPRQIHYLMQTRLMPELRSAVLFFRNLFPFTRRVWLLAGMFFTLGAQFTE